MSSCPVILSTKIRKSSALIMGISIAIVQTISSSTMAQQRGAASGVLPRTIVRERSRSMDEYDRELDRLKVAELVSSARRRSLLRQINEDFHGIQVVHDEFIVMIRSREALKYERLIELSAEMKKRSKRLRENLSLPNPEGEKENIIATANPSDAEVKESIFSLHDAVVSFVTNPIFQHLGLLDVDAVNRASDDLKVMILQSERIKNAAEALRRQGARRKE